MDLPTGAPWICRRRNDLTPGLGTLRREGALASVAHLVANLGNPTSSTATATEPVQVG
ncbi:hypothetical protein IU469_04485 [Nocardia puris]|uniref:hypothetical protein n=1 Tax=Nocardia puris TaxID=208602 RepID=UPI0018932172|nr:hypothetical protein [Nocardia puris]MBF6364987.1 hypothetical protein [Nocardia puris]